MYCVIYYNFRHTFVPYFRLVSIVPRLSHLCLFQVTVLTLAIVQLGNGDGAAEAPTTPRSRCRKPRREKLMAQLINATASGLQPGNDTLRTAGHFNSSLCSDNSDLDWTGGQDMPLNQRSLCPWTLELGPRSDGDTFPSAIAEARCLCRRCQMAGSTHQCRPVHQPMTVLRKTRECDEMNRIVYVPVRYLVAVGCTCVDASV